MLALAGAALAATACVINGDYLTAFGTISAALSSVTAISQQPGE